MTPTLLIVIGVVAFVAWTLWRARPQVRPEELKSALQAGTAVLVDVREPSEWLATGTAQDAALLPLSDLRGDRRQWNAFLGQHRGKRLFLYCQSGARSSLAAAQLRREGLDARNAGSLAALDRGGWPLTRKRG
ncbi:rhodanese-like domain-containing protein [Oleiharenicola lentus]|jgi:rhodanese-related sulfurtransferase|uniref:Rhodanese-like domain-containing protein n=1 Tax=Oleiharenicola lentus TaxID=2508720 RepID=A0A4Q1C6P2_9BACT|nr:rhodanese-like domain-containing protein [Oleiharenicola lentus]RXK54468.1 rhodanese-like domain-containing protein [Oleiharenicola lentus]